MWPDCLADFPEALSDTTHGTANHKVMEQMHPSSTTLFTNPADVEGIFKSESNQSAAVQANFVKEEEYKEGDKSDDEFFEVY